MSYPPRPPMGMPPMFGSFGGPGGMPPGMGIPPLMNHQQSGGGNPPPQFYGGHMPPNTNVPPPLMRNSTISKPPMLDEKPTDHPMPYPQPTGPPVTVFVGNITEKWPDAMIRQLLATCGQVINWKRVQGASGKLQGFGFCEFNGPDAGLRSVRLLHDLQVGDKKMVVKVDAKTQSLLEDYKAEKRKKKSESGSSEETKNGNGAEPPVKSEDGEIETDYMDQEMKEFDERSKHRIQIIFREFKNEIEAYIPPGSEKAKADAAGSKQQIQDKLHLLKLSSIDATLAGSGMLGDDPDLPEDLEQDEGKREIITREIIIFRESMKQEQEREEERKRLGRERREKEREREERKRQRERDNKGAEDITSPDHLLGRDRSRERDRGNNRDNNRGQNNMNNRNNNMNNNFNNRGMMNRDRRDRSRDRRRRSRDRGRSKSRSVERILRSPGPVALSSKPRYREREEEEEQVDQKRLERKAREKEAAYEQRLRDWETREAQKAREYKKLKDRLKRQEEELIKEAKKMKQFLEDYDDEKHDSKYYKGKDLQKRLADRARELEDDNKDRQREREELEEMKLRMMTSSAKATPNSNITTPSTLSSSSLLEKYKRPTLSPTPTPLFSGLKMELKPSINSRLQAIANNQAAAAAAAASAGGSSGVTTISSITPSPSNHVGDNKNKDPLESPAENTPKTSFATPTPIIPIAKLLSNPTTPINNSSSSLISPVPLKSPSLSATGTTTNQSSKTGSVPIINHSPATMVNNNNNNSSSRDDEDDSRQSFSPAPSPGMASVSPQNFSRDDDDSSMQSPLEPKRKKISVKDVFNQDEDDTDGFGLARKRKLVPLDFGEVGGGGDPSKKAKILKEEKNPEEKKKNIKALIDKIPTDKDALFSYEIDWEMVDSSLMEKRIRPWINKKIVEYIGEPEPTLVDFICSKVLGRSAPRSILEDVVMVLDEEAEVFVVKMWRLLVYEIEAKKYGLAGGKSQ